MVKKKQNYEHYTSFLLNPTHRTAKEIVAIVNMLIYLVVEHQMGRLIRSLPFGVFLHTNKSSIYIHRQNALCVSVTSNKQVECIFFLTETFANLMS